MSDQEPHHRSGVPRLSALAVLGAMVLGVSLALGLLSGLAHAAAPSTGARRSVGVEAAMGPGSGSLAEQAPTGGGETAQGGKRDVEMKVESGLAGVVSAGVPLPVRLTITSKRARTVKVTISSQDGEENQMVELGADAPTVLDVALRAVAWVDISVRDSRGANLANRSFSLTPDPGRTVIGIGPSLFAKGVPEKSPTIGGIQQASLVALTDELLNRPGALRSLSSVVLDAGDLDRLDEPTRNALREWVWVGGDLVLDVEPRAQLPIVGQPSTGRTTPIGSGWVRFTSGAAQSGAWSTILEPAPVRSSPNSGMDQGFVRSTLMDSGGLLSVGFIPTWVVALAVFGSALLAGPVAWFVLRSRRQRRLIWGIAPGLSLVVATLLLFAGQGVFTAAKTKTFADIDSSPWSATGTVFSGLKESKTLELGGGSQLLAAVPDPSVSSSGMTQTVRMDLPRNSFGTVAVGGVVLDEGPRLEVSAVALDDGKANVTVTNHSDQVLENVSITGNGRVREFTSVQPGESETLPFEMSSELNVLNPVFGDPSTIGVGVALGSNKPIPGLELTQSRGLIMVSGVMRSSVKAAGLSGAGLVSVRALVPVQPSENQDGTAALRIDEIGGISVAQRQVFFEQGGEQVGDGVNFPTTTVGSSGEGEGAEPVVQPADYVRMTSQRGRPAQVCGVSTSAPTVDIWNGTSWAQLEKVGERYIDPRVIGFQADGHEMQDWMIPALEAGGRIHLRVGGRVFATPPSMLFQCGGRK